MTLLGQVRFTTLSPSRSLKATIWTWDKIGNRIPVLFLHVILRSPHWSDNSNTQIYVFGVAYGSNDNEHICIISSAHLWYRSTKFTPQNSRITMYMYMFIEWIITIQGMLYHILASAMIVWVYMCTTSDREYKFYFYNCLLASLW